MFLKDEMMSKGNSQHGEPAPPSLAQHGPLVPLLLQQPCPQTHNAMICWVVPQASDLALPKKKTTYISVEIFPIILPLNMWDSIKDCSRVRSSS